MTSDNFFEHTKEDINGCWIWQRAQGSKGYGRLKYQGKLWGANRLAYALACGPIPKGQCVLHRCDVPQCVNPEHLFLGTIADNNRDMARKGRSSRGSRRHSAKLNEFQVQAIRASEKTRRELAGEYGVSKSQIERILIRKRWAYLQEAL